jgi:hypothetical protein
VSSSGLTAGLDEHDGDMAATVGNLYRGRASAAEGCNRVRNRIPYPSAPHPSVAAIERSRCRNTAPATCPISVEPLAEMRRNVCSRAVNRQARPRLHGESGSRFAL